MVLGGAMLVVLLLALQLLSPPEWRGVPSGGGHASVSGGHGHTIDDGVHGGNRVDVRDDVRRAASQGAHAAGVDAAAADGLLPTPAVPEAQPPVQVAPPAVVAVEPAPPALPGEPDPIAAPPAAALAPVCNAPTLEECIGSLDATLGPLFPGAPAVCPECPQEYEPCPELEAAPATAAEAGTELFQEAPCPPCPACAAAPAPATSTGTSAASRVTVLTPEQKRTAAATKPIHTIQGLIDAYPWLPPVDTYPIKDKFSLIMMSYNRPEHVVWQLDRVMQIKSLHKLYLIFNDNTNKDYKSARIDWRVRGWIDESKGRIEPVFPSLNSMINRFVPPKNLETDIVMFLDDDMAVENAEVERAFAWSRQYPTQIVGFFPRTVEGKKGGSWKYVIPHEKRGHTVYHMVLPGGGTFINARLLHLFAESMDKGIFDFVRDVNDCDDIAFNMCASNFTGLPPVYALSTTHTTVDVKEKASAHKGMRAKADHASMRVTCLKKFIENHYKRNPLIDTDTMLAPFSLDKLSLGGVLRASGTPAEALNALLDLQP